MFELHQWPTAPVKRTKSTAQYQLGPSRWLPPELGGQYEEYLVDLTADDDHANAKSWPTRKKMINAAILGFDTVVASWGSSVYSGAITYVSEEFHVSSIVALLGLSLYILGFATGPLAFGPMSEIYGRRIPIVGAKFVFMCFIFAAGAAKDFQTLMLCRFFAGVFASCPLAVVGGAFSDMFGNDTRGLAIAFYTSLVFIGPFISPIVGTFISQSYLGWRWTEYITGIMGAIALVIDVLFLQETMLKTILRRRAATIRVETQNFAIHHVSEEELLDMGDLVEKRLLTPLKLLFLEPIVFLVTTYTAFIYGIMYLFLEAYPVVFAEARHINPAVATLPYLALIVGVIVGCLIVVAFEPRYHRKLRENNNIPVPEERLLPMMVG